MMAAYSVGCMISGVKMVFLNQSGKKRNKFIYGSIKRFMTITLKHDIFISRIPAADQRRKVIITKELSITYA